MALWQKVVNLFLLQPESLSQDAPLERHKLCSLYVVKKTLLAGPALPSFLVNCPPHLLPRRELVFLKSGGLQGPYSQMEKAHIKQYKIQ